MGLSKKRPIEAGGRVGRESGLFDELARVNDELATVRRELGRKAVELEAEVRRRETVEALGKSEEMCRALAEVAQDFIFISDRDGRIVYANSYAAERMGRRPEDIVGKPLSSLFPADVAERLDRNARQVIESGLALDFEDRVLLRGREVWLDSRLIPMKSGSGDVYAALGICRDTTERKHVQENLRESEERFRSLVETTSDWVWEVDEHMTYTYASPQVRDLLGYEPGEVLGKTPFDLMPRDEAERVSALFAPILAGRKPFNRIENTNRHKNGELVVLETSGVPFFGPDGTFRGHRGIDRDITKRKRAEEARAQHLAQEQAVRAAAQRQAAQLNALLESLTEGVIVVDSTGRIVLMNSVGRRIFQVPELPDGWTPEDYRRLDMRGLDEKPLPFEEWPVNRALRGEQFTDQEVIYVQPDGSRRRLVFIGSAVRGEEDRVVLALNVFRDVTELRHLEQTRDEFVNTISHDLRNPLTVIMGQTGWLRRILGKKGLEQEARTTEAMLTSARRMNSMIQDLAESAHLESGTLEMHTQPTDMGQLVSSIAERVGSLQDRARIQVEIPEWVPPVAADHDRIERAIVNLITNALKYSPPDSPVVVRVGRSDGQAVISVSDRGVGIPPEDLPHIFDRFFRARTGKKAEGLGLGLYITRLLVEAHGGRVWVESLVGEGSTFSFTLPLSS